MLHRVRLGYRVAVRAMSSGKADPSDLAAIMSQLGFGDQQMMKSAGQQHKAVRQAVSHYLSRGMNEKYEEPPAPELTPAQEEEVQRKVAQWTNKYQSEWSLKREVEAAKKERRQMTASQKEKEESESEMSRQRPQTIEESEKSDADLDGIIHELPSIAKQYVANRFGWEEELVRLEQEIQLALCRKKAIQFTEAYIESDPLRTHLAAVQAEQKHAPLLVRLSSLLECIDPRFATTLKETGISLPERKVDMSQPNQVIRVLTELGYSITKDGKVKDVERQPIPFEGDEREQLIRGVRPNGTPMSEEEKWEKILGTPEISSPALDQKRRQIQHYLKQQNFKNRNNAGQGQQASAELNPDLLPEELRPTIEDLDPDSKPVFANRDVPQFTECPICARPRTGPGSRQRCGLSKDNAPDISHTNVALLNSFVNDFGMIIPKKKTGVCSKYQRRVAVAIKRSRHMGLMPYTSKLKFGDAVKSHNFDMYNLVRRHGLLQDRRPSHNTSQSL
uniref:30S ribosomal protein S18 n=1 Tax=Spongospora subterranea TaxID=70186 RepID=A0A0H5R7K3_9EUKA|eukprot:CRZ10140.1 hypothetical protein [Spongospora subterranea]